MQDVPRVVLHEQQEGLYRPYSIGTSRAVEFELLSISSSDERAAVEHCRTSLIRHLSHPRKTHNDEFAARTRILARWIRAIPTNRSAPDTILSWPFSNGAAVFLSGEPLQVGRPWSTLTVPEGREGYLIVGTPLTKV